MTYPRGAVVFESTDSGYVGAGVLLEVVGFGPPDPEDTDPLDRDKGRPFIRAQPIVSNPRNPDHKGWYYYRSFDLIPRSPDAEDFYRALIEAENEWRKNR